ncbi:anti-sigma factor domain-containing protein [Ornithinimicrobium sp. LYQ103]|uniref:anti-sigma factor n=1 Tax=Ornithinimicrobium sp. LYQ103 TaxID=3378796 RepID=UPI0038536A1A
MHVDPDDLALVALGEGGADANAHVAGCPACAAEVRSLREVRDLVVAGGPLERTPPVDLWAGIEAAALRMPSTGASTVATVAPDELAARRERRAGGGGRPVPRIFGFGLVAAAAGGAAAMWLGLTLADREQPSTDTLVASAELEALDTSLQPAAASLVERDGQRVLVLDAADLPEVEDGYLEVWLLAPDASGMVTVGLLEPGQTEFVLPADLSTDDFPVVDVSVEHYDGDPTHSGDSLWRGPIVRG